MLHRYLPFLAVIATAHLGAQTTCHYVPSNTPGAGGCNVIPWGMNSPTWANQRYQTKITIADLGNAKRTITDLAFAPCNTGTHSSATLVIRMAHHKGALTSNFATNLGNAAVTVLNKKNHSWAMTASAWSKVGLTGFFSYDPAKGDLLLDILVTGNSTTASHAGGRPDSRQRLYAYNWVGVPPPAGTIGNTAALKMRVCTGTPNGSFTDYGNGCGRGPLTIVGSGTPNLTKKFGLNLTNGRASSGGFILVGAVQQSQSLAPIGMPGCTLYLTPVFSSGVALDAKGVSASLSFGVPNNPYFIGKTIYGQGANIDSGSNVLNLTVSQGTTITFGK
ncbi:MAG: hypothetical protein QF412_04200 [Planctomycetota bacterium]|jgi:hypothetical protein|nr:hypothetical protein [Planctomycetota bacterium]